MLLSKEKAISANDFESKFQVLPKIVDSVDPEGCNFHLRIYVAWGLYACFDLLKSQERPFDREFFWSFLEQMAKTIKTCPPVSSRKTNGSVLSAWTKAEIEKIVANLYSRCWTHYNDEQFSKTVDLFEERFRLNQIDITSLVKSKRCLDAGCGSGRYTVALAKLGACEAVGIDLSQKAVDEASERAQRLGRASKVRFVQGSVIDMPKEWENSFDFVCSNGVVHHTTNYDKGLREIYRVLKPGATAYIYVYGAGLPWRLEDAYRQILKPVPMEYAESWLSLLNIAAGKIFNFLDHGYVPNQTQVTQEWLEARLQSLGFVNLRYMPRAIIYDSSERRHRFPEDRDLMGDGDLRYLASKPL